MPTTTLTAIRDDMVSIVRGLTPAELSTVPFVVETEQSYAFDEWAEANPQAAFRRFAVIDTLEDELGDAINNEAWIRTTVQLAVAYPNQHALYGSTGDKLRAVLRSDRDLLEDNLGDPGYGNLTTPATVQLESVSVERGEATTLLLLELLVHYWRDLRI